MKSWLPNRHIASALLALAVGSVPTAAMAQRLGGGAAPEVSFVRVAAALVICLAIALFALLLIRQRQQRGSQPAGLLSIFTRLKRSSSRFEIVEARRLNPSSEVCLLRFENCEYLLLLSQGHSRLLSERAMDEPADGGSN